MLVIFWQKANKAPLTEQIAAVLKFASDVGGTAAVKVKAEFVPKSDTFEADNITIRLGGVNPTTTTRNSAEFTITAGHELLTTGSTLVTFFANNQPIFFQADMPRSGKRIVGYEPPRGELNVSFRAPTGERLNLDIQRAGNDDNVLKKFTKVALETTINERTGVPRVILVIESNDRLHDEMAMVNKIKYGSVLIAAPGAPRASVDGTKFVYRFLDVDPFIERAFVRIPSAQLSFEDSSGNELFKGSTTEPVFVDDVEVSIVPIKGWTRGEYKYQIEDDKSRTMDQVGGSTSRTLTDDGGLLAIGYHIADAVNKITPFILLSKDAVLASQNTCRLTAVDENGRTKTFTLNKFDVTNSDVVQEF